MEDSTFAFTTNTYTTWNVSDENLMNATDVSFPNDSSARNDTPSKSSISEFYPVIIAEMVLSIICLILSIIVYSILPEFKNVHGKNLISLSSCLMTTYLLLCLDIALRFHISHSFCFTLAVIIHVTFLATFFWTNVMTFDIYSNITSMKPKSEVKSSSRKYLKYSIYAWSATILTTVPAIILELTDLVPLASRPQFGVKRCWLNGITAFIYYFNLPVGVILLGNLIMFILTIRRLNVIKKMTAILQVKKHQKRLNLYLKLFFVMGIVWFSEFLPWVTKFYKLYALAGMLTALQGFLLFVIFVLKRRVLRQIKGKVFGETAKTNSTSQQTLSTGQISTSHKWTDRDILTIQTEFQ